jgi:drug/metabolite transporter (DMT)-like permease
MKKQGTDGTMLEERLEGQFPGRQPFASDSPKETVPAHVQSGSKSRPSLKRLILAFAAIYSIWGSTYLAIRFSIETIPPFLMGGARFIIAGSLLYGWMRLRGTDKPTWAQWRSAAIIGALLFLGSNGALMWAEQRIDSGMASLLVSTIPLWMVLITHVEHRSKHHEARLGGRVIAGLIFGLVGVGLLLGPSDGLGHGGVDRLGAAVLLSGALAWALGSLYSRRATLPRSTLLAASMEMLCGGLPLIVLGIVTGETRGLHLGAISMRSAFGVLYLITFGSLIGFTCYNWLLTHSTPARVSTYAYVNPVVAVFLGWAVASETVTFRTLTAAALVVAAVALIITHRGGMKDASPSLAKPLPTSDVDDDAVRLVPLD